MAAVTAGKLEAAGVESEVRRNMRQGSQVFAVILMFD
jgi:hypothetical protein